jgi:hypothetical protein
MALAAVQAILARLFTDAPFRSAFFDDPIAVGRSCGLDPAEARSLAEVSRKEVEEFAATLRRKRVADVRQVLPLTARALGDAFADYVRPAIAGPARAGRHRDDARAVAGHLRRLARSRELAPPWVADLVRYEAAFSEAQRRPACMLVRCFRFPVAALAAAILVGAPTVGIEPRMTVGLWLRWPGRRGAFHRVW